MRSVKTLKQAPGVAVAVAALAVADSGIPSEDGKIT